MRLFVAVYPSDEVLDAVEAALAPTRAVRTDLRWMARAEWHLTLVFLGEIPEDRATDLEKRLGAEVPRHAAPALSVRGVGTFPGDDTQARVLWAGLEGDVDRLTGLATGLRRIARKAGVQVEHRPYVPHLTLARTRAAVDLSELRTSLSQLATPFWTAGEVHLVQSRPGGEPRYQTVATWPLG